ncbi:MAG: radical SAM protein, partial [Elusimicrobiota bacterium]|nr:radical SAM protein [Elusimicrobiota bacterium]
MKNEIILFQPEEPNSRPNYLPYSLLPVAGILEQAGYNVRIVDTRFEEYKKIQIDGAVFCGITSFTGHQIKYALEVASWIKDKNANIPIVWGGIHASLLPIQTCSHPLVDMVVKGEGEETVVELAEAIEKNKLLENIRGIVYKENGKIKENEMRPWFDMNKEPLPPFHLLKTEQYKLDVVSLNTSRGCPFQCTFCFNRNWNKASYRYQQAELVVDQMEWAKKWFPNVDFIGFNYDNFFVKRDRVKEVCREIINRGLKIKWSAMCRADYICQFDPEMFQLLKSSGFERFGIGGESGSVRILRKIKKGTTPETLLRAIEKCKENDIQPIVSFMMGFPSENLEEVYSTLDIVDEMRRIYDKAITNGIFIFTPYPGTEAFDEAVEYGFKVPTSLDGWAEKFFSDPKQNPWYGEEYDELLSTIQG